VLSGLFTFEEVTTKLMGDNIEKISFAFFKQLSIKTGHAWTKLTTSHKERGECDWIPVVENSGKDLTTHWFSAVFHLGRLKEKGLAKTVAMTGLSGVPRSYMRI
jgi:hypothetical protein